MTDPLEAQRMAEAVTRPTIGVEDCPVQGIPSPNELEELEVMKELDPNRGYRYICPCNAWSWASS